MCPRYACLRNAEAVWEFAFQAVRYFKNCKREAAQKRERQATVLQTRTRKTLLD